MLKKFLNKLTKKSQEIADNESVKNFVEKLEDVAEVTAEKAKDVYEDIKENEASMNFGMHNAYFEMKNGAENAEFAESMQVRDELMIHQR